MSIPFHLDESRPQHEPRPLKVPRSYLSEPLPPDPPSVSVVTPVLNAAGFVGQAMDSVLGQGYPRLQYVVMDGGSEDGTVEAVESRLDGLARFESAADAGPAQAINRGFEHTTGEVMVWLNADDLLLPGAIARAAGHLARHPEVDVVYGNRLLIDEAGRQVGIWATPRHGDTTLPWFGYVPQETAFWRRSAWERAGGLDETLQLAFDWDLFLRMERAGARFHRIPRFQGCFRIHPGQRTRARQADALLELERVRAAHHGRQVGLDEARARVDGLRVRSLAHHAWERARLGLARGARIGSG